MAFAPIFQRPFSATFDRRAAAAAAASWWQAGGAPTPVAVYQPKGAASLAASYVNLANPGTYDAALGVAPSFDAATGWTFNGIDQYLTTGITPAQDQSWSILCRVDNITNSNGKWVLGSGLGASRLFGLMSYSDGTSNFLYGGENKSGAVTPTGTLSVAGNTGYRNGSAVAGSISAPIGALGALFIGATNWFGSALGHVAGNIQAVAIYNTTLSAAQVLAISTAMAAL